MSWEDVVTGPIVGLFALIGALHAIELSQKVTLPLLRELRRKVARIVGSAEKHGHELWKIVRLLTRSDRVGP